jgi:predicted nuclease of predicted toxin-antitoxin system
VKFLIDRCAGSRLAQWLRAEGHDVDEARHRGTDPGDETLLGWATSEGRVLVTIDTDFGTLLRLRGQAHAGLIRLPDVPPSTRIALMEEILQRHGAEDLTRLVITVKGSRIRVSRSE